jgi:hypothetical protein
VRESQPDTVVREQQNVEIGKAQECTLQAFSGCKLLLIDEQLKMTLRMCHQDFVKSPQFELQGCISWMVLH